MLVFEVPEKLVAEASGRIREEMQGALKLDVPLLVEADIARNYDEIVVASAPEAIRVKRMIELRGMTADAAWARIGAQAPEAKRLAIADVVIDTGGDVQHTRAQVDALWARLQHSNASQ